MVPRGMTGTTVRMRKAAGKSKVRESLLVTKCRELTGTKGEPAVKCSQVSVKRNEDRPRLTETAFQAETMQSNFRTLRDCYSDRHCVQMIILGRQWVFDNLDSFER